MSNQGATTIATEQLLELLLQLKKTTPAAAKKILNDQPSIAYALITLMVSMNAINVEVFHKVLADYSAGSVTSNNHAQQPQPPPTASGVVTPAPAIPPHLQQAQAQVPLPYRNATPPTIPPTPVYPNGTNPSLAYPPYGPPPQPIAGPGYASGYPPPPPAPQPGFPPSYPPYGGGLPPQATSTPPTNPTGTAPALPDVLASIPEDQKAIIMRVLSMTPEQINMLPPTERATYIQLRATLGVPTS